MGKAMNLPILYPNELYPHSKLEAFVALLFLVLILTNMRLDHAIS